MRQNLKAVRTFNYKDHSRVLFQTNSTVEMQNDLQTQDITCTRDAEYPNKEKKQRQKLQRGFSYMHLSKTADCLLNHIETNQNNHFTIKIEKVKDDASLTPEMKSQSLIKHRHLWNKTLNVQKMVNAFLHPAVTKIDDNIIMTQTFKDSLLGDNNGSCNNSLLKANTDTNNNNNNNNNNTQTNNCIPFGAFILKPEVDKELIRVALKERVYKCIIEGTNNDNLMTEELEKLFNLNPEKNVFVTSSKHHLFNHLLPNGKTLLYVACQEGSLDVVKYFISKGLNPNIRVKYGNMEDCCLWVACRWDYYDIVHFLLSQDNLCYEDIKYAIDNEKMSKKMLQTLHKGYSLLKSKTEKEKSCRCY